MQELLQTDFINQLESEVEEQLKEVIGVFQNLPEDLLLQPAADHGWSIAECFAHLNTYSDFYLPRIEMSLEQEHQIDQSRTFKHSFLGRYFVTMMDPAQGRKKYKAMKKHRPASVHNPHAIVSKFIEYLEMMQVIIKRAKDKNLKGKSIATSVSPWIKISSGDAIRFVLTHNKRHIEQARRSQKV